MKKRDNKGFTLVELLAVIVVLAVIMVIAGTSILNTINKNRADSFVSTARIIHSTLKQCAVMPNMDADSCKKMVDIQDTDTNYDFGLELIGKTYTYTLTAKSDGKFANVDLKSWYECPEVLAAASANTKKKMSAGVTECSKNVIKGEYKY